MIDELDALLDQLAEADPSTLADSDTIVRLQRVQARVEAINARAVARWDARAEWAADGARSGAAWLAGRCRLPKPTARRRIRLGRALRHLPAAEAAWLAGDLDAAHVSALASKRNDRTALAMDRDEAMLVDQARRMRFSSFARALAYWYQLNDESSAERDAEALHDERRVHLSPTFQGARRLDGLLDPIGGAVVENALHAIEQELFEADWAEARARLGERFSVHDLRRTPAQRRADALVEMARRAQAAPAGARMPAPLFTVLVGYETFAGRICELADGTVVTPGSLLPWLDEAYVERVVFDGPSRVVDVGVRRRFFTGATRTAVEVRDRECFDDLCDIPAHRCQIDHVEPYASGGLTVQANGRPACGHHNRLRNRRPQGP